MSKSVTDCKGNSTEAIHAEEERNKKEEMLYRILVDFTDLSVDFTDHSVNSTDHSVIFTDLLVKFLILFLILCNKILHRKKLVLHLLCHIFFGSHFSYCPGNFM